MKKRDIATDLTEIKKIIREYYEQTNGQSPRKKQTNKTNSRRNRKPRKTYNKY